MLFSHALSHAIWLALSPLPAEPPPTPPETKSLTPIVVSALGMKEEEAKIATPLHLIDGESLLKSAEGTLGEALSGLVGVHADTFGGGASRPVIRGQEAPRIKVLSDGTALLDASDISPDHAINADPLLLQRVEVLRGPATLRYGSGAVGGVINLLDNKIPDQLPEKTTTGLVALRANSVANEQAGAASLTHAASSNWVMHAELSHRDADDQRAPLSASPRSEGTFSRSGNASTGLSWIGDYGYIGLAYSLNEARYGLPGHDHDSADCHPHGAQLHCGGHGHEHSHESEYEHAGMPVVDLRSQRIDLRGDSENPFTMIRRIRLRASHTDYRHNEQEAGHTVTRFENAGQEARLEVEHEPVGRWSGLFGLQWTHTRSNAQGEEAFLPATRTQSTGLFWIEHLHINDAWHMELGTRHEHLQHQPYNDPRQRPRFTRSANSQSAALVWSWHPEYHLSLSTARSERLPHVQELYADGPHLATNTWECGLLPHTLTCGGSENDAPLKAEISRNLELGLRHEGDVTGFEINLFHNHVRNHVHARTLDRHDAFQLIKYSQNDVRFHGMEVEGYWQMHPHWRLSAFGDRTRALDRDTHTPLARIPAERLGLRLQTARAPFQGEISVVHTASQHRIAEFESPTPGHSLLNAGLEWQWKHRSEHHVFLRGTNLTNQLAWNHTSFLSDEIPLPGRNFSLGYLQKF